MVNNPKIKTIDPQKQKANLEQVQQTFTIVEKIKDLKPDSDQKTIRQLQESLTKQQTNNSALVNQIIASELQTAQQHLASLTTTS